MTTFSEKLNDIKLYELIAVLAVSYILLMFLGFDEQWIYIVVIAYVFIRLRKELFTVREEISSLFSQISFKTWILLIISSYILALGFGWFLEDFINYTYFAALTPTSGEILLDFAFSVVIAPVAEEIIFRGILLNRLRQKLVLIFGCLVALFILFYTGNLLFIAVLIFFLILFLAAVKFNVTKEILTLILAILISSMIFAFLHPAAAIISSVIFGITTAVVYLKTENIFVSISIHMANNLLSLVVSMLPFMETLFSNDSFLMILAVMSLLSFAYIVRFILKEFCKISDTL